MGVAGAWPKSRAGNGAVPRLPAWLGPPVGEEQLFITVGRVRIRATGLNMFLVDELWCMLTKPAAAPVVVAATWRQSLHGHFSLLP